MAINFPSSPTNGQTHTEAGVTWTYNSAKAAWLVTTSGTLAAHNHPESDITNLVADLALKAPLASPALTGNPTAPTQAPGDNDTSIATTGFVKAAIDVVLGGVSAAFDTLAEIATELALKATIASPTFTGDPKAPTAAPGDNDTSIATTAFVTAAIAAGGAGGVWEHIATLTPTGVATENLFGLGAYRALRITGINILPATDGSFLWVRLSSDGSTFLATNYAGSTYSVSSAGVAAGLAGSTTAFEIRESTLDPGNVSSDGGIDFEAIISSFSDVQKTKISGSWQYGSTAATRAFGQVQGWHNAQTAMQGIQFLFNSGNIASGTIVVEGLNI